MSANGIDHAAGYPAENSGGAHRIECRGLQKWGGQRLDA